MAISESYAKKLALQAINVFEKLKKDTKADPQLRAIASWALYGFNNAEVKNALTSSVAIPARLAHLKVLVDNMKTIGASENGVITLDSLITKCVESVSKIANGPGPDYTVYKTTCTPVTIAKVGEMAMSTSEGYLVNPANNVSIDREAQATYEWSRYMEFGEIPESWLLSARIVQDQII